MWRIVRQRHPLFQARHPIAEHVRVTRNWIVGVLNWLYVSFHSAVEAGFTDMLEGIRNITVRS